MSCDVLFFFKQKTAYEMRISDWSSDVCSSDLLGFDHPWLPKSWLRRSFRRADVARMLRPAIPWLQKVEKYLKPRLERIAGWRARRLIGAIVLWNAILLSLPIPFGNLIPAWAIILAALGQIERDGMLVLSSIIVSVLATGWVGLLIFGGLEIIRKLLGM